MRVLALSQAYQPSSIIPWERAITLLYENKVEVVENSSKVIRSPSIELLVPEIVRFIKGGTRKKQAIKFSRDSIYLRDKGTCQYCGLKVSRDDMSYDHVIPRALGGRTVWANIVTACYKCNQKKGGRTPKQAGLRLIKAPIKPSKLPTNTSSLVWRSDYPTSWRDYLSDEYWNIELEP